MFHQLIVFACTTLVLGAPTVGRNSSLRYPDVEIVGGQDADIEDYPYQISLWRLGQFVCGGSIIDRTHILTAAHCTHGSSAEQFQIRAGTSFLAEGETAVNVRAIYQNPSFDRWKIDYDVSVLLLESPFNFTKTIAPIGLAEDELLEGATVEITGWGTIKEGGDSPDQLQVVRVPIVSRKKCRSAYGDKAITDRMICAGFDKGGKDSCQGDSGGPLVRNGKQYGIISWGYGCAAAGYPGVYSNIVELRNFIVSIMKQH